MKKISAFLIALILASCVTAPLYRHGGWTYTPVYHSPPPDPYVA